MSTIESAHDDDRAGAERPAQATVYGSSGRTLVAEHGLPTAARPSRQRLRTTGQSVARFLRACIYAALRDDVPERIQQIPEYREAQTEMLRYHLLRQTR